MSQFVNDLLHQGIAGNPGACGKFAEMMRVKPEKPRENDAGTA